MLKINGNLSETRFQKVVVTSLACKKLREKLLISLTLESSAPEALIPFASFPLLGHLEAFL